MPARATRTALGLLLAVALVAPAAAQAATAAARIGAGCVIKGKQVQRNGVHLQCAERRHHLVWVRVWALPTPRATVYDPLEGTITVFAAASLTESFDAIAQQFEAVHPRVQVVLSFGASSTLAAQIIQGAPADVFASASTGSMAQTVNARLVVGPSTFARNRLIIVTAPGNPRGITSVADLARPGVKVAVCQVLVPCGTVAKQVLANAKVSLTPVTYEVDVKSVLTKVLIGEVDAGLVYVTDARSAGDKVAAVLIPSGINAETTYPIARLVGSRNPDAAQAFIDFVLGDRGAAALAAVGFTVL